MLQAKDLLSSKFVLNVRLNYFLARERLCVCPLLSTNLFVMLLIINNLV